MKNIIYFVFLCVLMGTALSARAQNPGAIALETAGGRETITLPLAALGRFPSDAHKEFTLPNPERLVADIPTRYLTKGEPRAEMPAGYAGDLVKGVRRGQFNDSTTRFVFDLARPVKILQVREEEGAPALLHIDIAADDGTKTPSAPPKKKEVKAAEPPKKPPKPLIAIDPGHGGQDPGTIGPRGTYEKNLVLQYSRLLQDKLIAGGKYRVVMTREGDRFIPLRERVAIARRAGADIFIAIHADSASEKMARGLSVYTVSEKASDEESEKLAARENKSDLIAGVNLSGEREEVADILISLAQRETMNHSSSLADLLVASLDDRVTLLPNSHRFAGFAVLKAADVPSVLIEIGFLSNKQEEKLLQSREYREKVTDGIVAGINAYFRQRDAEKTE